MKLKNIVIAGLLVLFFGGVYFAFMGEISREEEKLAGSISGFVEVDDNLFRAGLVNLVKTDRLILYLLDAETKQRVAQKSITPFVPPQTIEIMPFSREGQKPDPDRKYILIGISDKDGEIFKITPGEIYGRSPTTFSLGTEGIKLVLNEGYKGGLFNDGQMMARSRGQRSPRGSMGRGRVMGAESAGGGGMNLSQNFPDEVSIQGTVTSSEAVEIEEGDRLVVMLFPEGRNRPIGINIIPITSLPATFKVGVKPLIAETLKSGGVQLRIVLDKNMNPFGAAPGERVGRSKEDIPLGTKGLKFVMDQPYVR